MFHTLILFSCGKQSNKQILNPLFAKDCVCVCVCVCVRERERERCLRILPCSSKDKLKYSQGITSRQIVPAVKENNLQIGILQRHQYFDFGNRDTVQSCRWNIHYRSTLCHNSKDCSLNTHHYENLDFLFHKTVKKYSICIIHTISECYVILKVNFAYCMNIPSHIMLWVLP